MALYSSAYPISSEARPVRNWTEPALLFAVIVAGLSLVGNKLLSDPDSHWHVKIGADIWRDKALPWIDAYSHTFAGSPWIAKEWLSQVLLYAANAAGGPLGLVMLTAVAMGLAFSLMFAWLSERTSRVAALTITLISFSFLLPHTLARPHILALLPMVFWMRGLIEALERGRAPRLWTLVALIAWANLHNSFIIAYPIAGFLALDALIAAPASQRIATAGRWAAFGAAAVIAGCVTPYGYLPLLVPFMLFGSGEPLTFISEWAPIGWGYEGALTVLTALATLWILARGGAGQAGRILVVLMLTAMSIRHSRFLDLYALVVPFVLAAPLVARLPQFASASDAPTDNGSPAHRLGCLAVAVLCVGAALSTSPHHQAKATPSAALDAALAAGLNGPVYNNYDFGGYLIARGVPTFIDGRADQLFLGGFSSGLMRAIADENPKTLTDFIGRYDVAWAIVHSVGSEARRFEAAGWRVIHKDEVATVFAKP